MSNKAGLYSGTQDEDKYKETLEAAKEDKSFSGYVLIKAEDFVFENDSRDDFKANIEIEMGLASRDLIQYFLDEYDKRKSAAPDDISSDR